MTVTTSVEVGGLMRELENLRNQRVVLRSALEYIREKPGVSLDCQAVATGALSETELQAAPLTYFLEAVSLRQRISTEAAWQAWRKWIQPGHGPGCWQAVHWSTDGFRVSEHDSLDAAIAKVKDWAR